MSADLYPTGRPNAVAEPAPARGTVAGAGGFIAVPDRIAIAPQAPQPEDAWRAQDAVAKLALASRSARDRLRSEEERTAKASANVAEAARSEEKARNKLIDARIDGRGIDRAMQDFDRASTHTANARRQAAVQADVLVALRERILASVRADLESAARAKLAAAHQRYDAAIEVLTGVPVFLRELRAARDAEAAAASELADATGIVPGIRGGQRTDRATGRQYRTIPALVDHAVLIVQEPGRDAAKLDTVAAVTSQLGRGSGSTEERPVLRPIDG